MTGKNIVKKLKSTVKLVLHKGDTYVCPFCNYSSRDLCPIGVDTPVLVEKQVVGGGRRFGGCYKCGSTDRERLLYIYLKEKMRIFDTGKDKSILHVAPELNLSKKMLEFGFKKYVCGDLYTDGYSYPKYVQNINLLHLPFNDNSFDLVICNHVLEHIPTDQVAMKEISRVMKTGGKAILQVPISKNTEKTFEDFSVTEPKQRELVFGQFDHVRIYGQDYSKRLEECGFKVTRVNISAEFAKYGLNKDEDIFIVEK
jgi:SAM-dependent methyltransferase